MKTVNPTKEQMQEIMAFPDDRPVVMVNLLKFRETAGDGPESGREAYDRYANAVAPMLAKVGGRLLWMGDVDGVFIGTEGDKWDRVMLVEYPSRKAFLAMIMQEEYREAHRDREKGLENSALLASTAKYMISG